MTRQNVRVRARGLGAELKDLRNQADMSLREVTDRLGWSPPTLSRIENGLRDSTPEEIASLLVLYKVTGARNDRLVRLARTIDQSGWWEIGASDLPSQLTALCAFEAEATKITACGIVLIPGLLQTPEYIRAVMRTGGVPEDAIDDRIAVRLSRQRILTRRKPPVFEAIIDEMALRRPMVDAADMAAQLRHLVKLAAQPHVTIRVLRNPRHPAVAGPYVILDFLPPALTFVHLEHFDSSAFIDDTDEVRSFQALTETVAQMALTPGSSQEFMAHLARQYEAEGHQDGRR